MPVAVRGGAVHELCQRDLALADDRAVHGGVTEQPFRARRRVRPAGDYGRARQRRAQRRGVVVKAPRLNEQRAQPDDVRRERPRLGRHRVSVQQPQPRVQHAHLMAALALEPRRQVHQSQWVRDRVRIQVVFIAFDQQHSRHLFAIFPYFLLFTKS